MFIEMARLSWDQKRKRKLAERAHQTQQRSVRRPDNSQSNRDIIAERVHRAVCDYTHSDGLGHCALYTLAGWLALGPGKYHMQVGTLRIVTDLTTGDGFAMEATDDGWRCGEFHAWLVRPTEIARSLTPGERQAVRPGELEWVDFSSRHYEALVRRPGRVIGREKAAPLVTTLIDFQATVEWRREPMPQYIWGRLPEGVYLSADAEATQAFYDTAQQQYDLRRLARLLSGR